MALPKRVLIVGGGVFGLSTALELSQRHPDVEITLLDASPTIPNPHGSSVDTSRIVRADYAHPSYAKLAIAALARWRNTDWGQEGRYTQNGLLLVYTRDGSAASTYTKKSYENVKALSGPHEAVDLLPTKADVLRVAPAYGPAIAVAGGYVNWGSGWADAEAGVRFVKQKLDKAGKVVFRMGARVERLLFAAEDDGARRRSRVTGVVLADGTAVTADLVVLATGAWSPKLVDLQGRAFASGQVLAYLRISDDEQRRLANMPTMLSFATGIFIIPPRNNVLKIARHSYGYINPTSVVLPGHAQPAHVSLPDTDAPVPLEGEEAIRSALKELLPSMADRPLSRTRICWYTDTPKGDFIVAYHPDHLGLFLATGGSGHAYKFFPVLGEKIVDALEGNLEPELRDLWAWPPPVEDFDATEDGSRSGQKALVLTEELAKTTKARRGSML